MVGLSGAALQGGDDVVEQRIVGGQRPEQLAAAADGQRRAADDLLRLDGKQVGRWTTPPCWTCVEASMLPCPMSMVKGNWPNGGLQTADLPGGRLLPARIGADRLKGDLGQPRGKGLVEFQGGRVMGQGLGVLAHLVIALALHRFVADRVDPARLRGLDRPAGLGLETFQGRAVVAVVIVGEGGVIVLGRHRTVAAIPPTKARAPAGRRRAGCCPAPPRPRQAQGKRTKPADETRRDGKKSRRHVILCSRDPVDLTLFTRIFPVPSVKV